MKKSWRILLICLLAAALLAACGGPNYNLYGTWRNDAGTLTLIFQQSGHVLFQQNGAVQNQLFEFSGPDAILIKPFEAAPAEQFTTLKYSINGDLLVLSVTTPGQDPTQPAQTQDLKFMRVK